jgi:hypothetical protein
MIHEQNDSGAASREEAAMNVDDATTGRRGVRHPAPPLGVVGAVSALLFFAGIAVSLTLAGGAHFPSPFAPASEWSAYFPAHTDAVRWSALLQFGASVPLAIYAATASSRLRFHGVQAAGATIALVGGVLASAFLALSALLQWVLGMPEVLSSAATVRALHLLAFATGGPGHVVPLGLLVAGLAVTGVLHRLLPRWMLGAGLVIAALAELSTLCLVVPGLIYLLPLARFPALIWLVVAGVRLPASRGTRTAPAVHGAASQLSGGAA